MSMLTAAAVIYQGKVLSSQLNVAVWPYVDFQTTTSENSVELDVQNVGAGPALIRGATLLIDGKPQPSLSTALRELGYRRAHGNDVTLSSIGPGDVVRAGESVAIARIRSAQFAQTAATLEGRVRLRVCYCSIIGDCWLARSDAEAPADIKSCDSPPLGAIAQ